MKQKKQVLFREFRREIRRSGKRYYSLLFIVALGVAFYSGVRSSEPDMAGSLDRYYDAQKVMDLRIVSTWGFTDAEIEEIRKVDGIIAAEGYRSSDVVCDIDEESYNLTVMSYTGGINEMRVEEGHLPYSPEECVMDGRAAQAMGLSVGDTLTVRSGSRDTELSEMLTVDTFKIVGIGYSPLFLTFERGACSTGDGSSDGYLMTSPQAFSYDYYTQVFARAEGAAEENTLTKKYDEKISAATEQLELIEYAQCRNRYDEVYAEASDALEDAKKQVSEGTTALDDAKKTLEENEKKLAEGKEEIDKGEKELADGWAEYEKGKKELEDGEKEYLAKQDEYDSAMLAISDAKNEITEGKIELSVGRSSYETGKAQYEMYANLLAGFKTRLAEARASLEREKEKQQAEANKQSETKQQSDAEDGEETQTSLYSRMTGNRTPIFLSRSTPSPGSQETSFFGQDLQLPEGFELPEDIEFPDPEVLAKQLEQLATASDPNVWNEQLEAIRQNMTGVDLTSLQTQLYSFYLAGSTAEMERILDGIDATVATYEAKLLQQKATLDAAAKQLEDGQAALTAAEATIAETEKTLAEAKPALNDAKQKIDAGYRTLSESYLKLSTADAQLAEARAQYEEGKKALDEGWETYNKEKDEADEKLADAEQKIKDGEKKLKDLQIPEWTVYDRNSIQSYVEYSNDSERIGRIGRIFPLIFFLVAALVALTTMTRMVEEQRGQIGTMKALGYGNVVIAGRYLLYALSATLFGSLAGVLFGEKVLPYVILNSYGILYSGLPGYEYPYQFSHGAVSTLASMVLIGAATFFASYRQLVESPASLMRPQAPMVGKKILLERIPFLWRPMPFTWKATFRNLFRYKKRFFMTVFGIGGCMGLLLTGFGLRDSVYTIAKYQFTELFHYEVTMTLKEATSDEEELAGMMKEFTDQDHIEDAMAIRMISADVGNSEIAKTSYIYIPKNYEDFEQFVLLRNRQNGDIYEFPTQGVAISEKLAGLLSVGVGDELLITYSDQVAHARVSQVVENYIYHYVFMTPEYFEQLFGKKPVFTTILLNTNDTSADFEAALGRQILADGRYSGVSFTSALNKNLGNTLQSLNLIVAVLILAAGLLAFVVLFNLNNINITERRRELATIRVLGFFDGELATYVYRENIILTFFGALVGVIFGLWLHSVVVRTVEVDVMMFGRSVKAMSYVLSVLFTFFFAAMVNAIMYFSLKKIDMVESLKSVE